MTFDLQVSYTVRGCPMTTGAQEVERPWTSFNFVLSKTVQDYR